MLYRLTMYCEEEHEKIFIRDGIISLNHTFYPSGNFGAMFCAARSNYCSGIKYYNGGFGTTSARLDV